MSALKIVYITGFGRSGSTLLDILLGSAPSSFGCGELNALVRLGINRGEPCACGDSVLACSVWRDVLDRWSLSGDVAGLARYGQLVDRVDSLRPGSSAVEPADQAFFKKHTLTLYQSIARTTESTVLIESSKSPRRLRQLLQIPQLQVQAIHLIRDVASVADSMSRSLKADPSGGIASDLRSRSVIRTAAAWRLHNVYADRVCQELGSNAMCVHIEDLLQSPDAVLAAIGRHTGLDLSHARAAVLSGKPITINHTVAGNRLRMNGSLTLQTCEARLDSRLRSRILRWAATVGLSGCARRRLTHRSKECCG